MRFNIHPYVGALPIKFGMHQKEVHAILGPPESSISTWNNNGYAEHYLSHHYNVGYDNNWNANHLGFGPGSVELSIQGELIWTSEDQPDPNPFLLAFDPEPMEIVGIWIYLKIGVTTTGYHDDDLSQLAVTVFTRGAFADLIADAKPAATSRY